MLNITEDWDLEQPTLGRGGIKSGREKEWEQITEEEVMVTVGKATGLDVVSKEIIKRVVRQ